MNPPPKPSEPAAQAPSPSGIVERQNEEQSLRYLAAQRQLYTEDKRWGYGWLMAVAAISIVGVLWQLRSPPAAPFVNFFVLAAAILGVIMSMFSQWRSEAAGVQEIFDCDLFGLDWNAALAEKPTGRGNCARRGTLSRPPDMGSGQHPSTQLVRKPGHPQGRAACRSHRMPGGEHSVQPEAAPMVGAVPGGCRRAALRRPVADRAGGRVDLVATVSGADPAVVAAGAGRAGNAVLHFQAAGDWERLYRLAQLLWHDAEADHLNDAALEQATRALQNEIYHVRRSYLPVPDWWYRVLKKYSPPLPALPS